MAFKPSENKDLTFLDFTSYIQDELGKTEWVTIFEFFDSKYPSVDRGTYYSALIPQNQREKCLEKADWDLLIGSGKPGFITSYNNSGQEQTEYYRFGDYNGIEPFVHWRSFRNRDVTVVEISEEFRLYFDLLETIQDDKRVFIYTSEDGDEEEVAIITIDKVEIKLRFLKEFLAAKKMSMAVYYEVMRFLSTTLEEVKVPQINNLEKKDSYIYSLYTRNLDLGDNKSQGWLLGKKLIDGTKDFKFSFWRSKEDERFEDFIIAVDEDGENVLASSNTDYHSSPGFLTPVFFKREVLKKYYETPDIFSVEDGYLRRESFWGLRIMNNHRDHVVVWLGELKMMPYKEQSHWRSFNLSPGDRKIAHADYTRSIEGQFCESEHPELYFKYRFEEFQNAWNQHFGWYLFEPLHDGDKYHMKSLHIPTTDGEKEFEDQVLSISKILSDSLNQKELSRGLQKPKESPRQIDWFEAFLRENGFNRPKMFEFLRKLQALRSASIAHRKGDKINAPYKYFDLNTKTRPAVFEDILVKCIWMLNSLEAHFQLGLDKE